MYNNNYEEYIRNIIGYPSQCNVNNNCEYNINENEFMYQENIINNIEQCYPEIYKIIYPMVKKVCNNKLNLNTPEEIDKATDEIYYAVEENNENNQINININLKNTTGIKTASEITNRNEKEDLKNRESRTNGQMLKNSNNNQKETRRIHNSSLRDLIKILIIRELIVKSKSRPTKTYRPPYSQVFPRYRETTKIGPRPPIMSRDLEYPQEYYDIY